jgi:hypothetical protein
MLVQRTGFSPAAAGTRGLGRLAEMLRSFAARRRALLPGATMRLLVPALLIAAISADPARARVLNEGDFERISQIKTSFEAVVSDMMLSSRRPDLSGGDSDCIKSAVQELLQISNELSSYEYLITIEKQMGDFGDDSAMRGILRFAVDKAIKILETNRRRLTQLSEQCARFPHSAGKTQQAIQFIDTTAAILQSLQPRL